MDPPAARGVHGEVKESARVDGHPLGNPTDGNQVPKKGPCRRVEPLDPFVAGTADVQLRGTGDGRGASQDELPGTGSTNLNRRFRIYRRSPRPRNRPITRAKLEAVPWCAM